MPKPSPGAQLAAALHQHPQAKAALLQWGVDYIRKSTSTPRLRAELLRRVARALPVEARQRATHLRQPRRRRPVAA